MTKQERELVVRETVEECIRVIGEDNHRMLTGAAFCTDLKRHFGLIDEEEEEE